MRSSPTTWRPSQTPRGSARRSCPITSPYVSNPILAALFAAFPAVRDRALADPTFLFKLGVEVFGDVGLSVAAEMHSRNDRFADEAEYFVADVVAGSALNAAVLTMLSPTVSFGVSPGGGRALRMLNRVDGRLNDFIRLLFCRALPPAFPASAFVPGTYPLSRRVGSLALQGVRVGASPRSWGSRDRRPPTACVASVGSTRPGVQRRVRRVDPSGGAAAPRARGGVGRVHGDERKRSATGHHRRGARDEGSARACIRPSPRWRPSRCVCGITRGAGRSSRSACAPWRTRYTASRRDSIEAKRAVARWTSPPRSEKSPRVPRTRSSRDANRRRRIEHSRAALLLQMGVESSRRGRRRASLRATTRR